MSDDRIKCQMQRGNFVSKKWCLAAMSDHCRRYACEHYTGRETARYTEKAEAKK